MGLFKGLLIFAVGAYSGIYAHQNYEIPPINNPKQLWENIQEILKKYEKSSKSDKEEKKD